MTHEQKQLIKKLKAQANKAMSKVISTTFDQYERNRCMLEIQSILADKIREVEQVN